MSVLLRGCRDMPRRQQVAGCYCGVADKCQYAGKDHFVTVALQSGAATLFIPTRLQSSLLWQDCQSNRCVGAAHTQGTWPYLHTGTVPSGERGTCWVCPGLQL